MWKHTVVVCVLLVSSSSALAGAIIDVIPLSPAPYAGGQRVEVQVRLTQQPGGHDIYLRGVQLDFGNTDPALGLDETFSFDYSGQAQCGVDPAQCGRGYVELQCLDSQCPVGMLDMVALVYIGWSHDPLNQIRLPYVGSIPVGSIGVTLPTVPGDYLLDVMSPDMQDPVNSGAQVYFGFGGGDPLTTWHPISGDECAGGRFTAITTADADVMFGYTPIPGAIVPEPASLALLALGGLAVLRLRGCRRG